MSWKEHFKNQFLTGIQFVYFVLKHFFQDDCSYIASALAFTTLLGIVPLMSVTLAVFSTFSLFREFADPLQDFIFDNFVPSTGKIIQTYLQHFTAQASKLSVWGTLFLLVTSLLMLFTIERAMNKIWRVGIGRQGVAAFLLYWSILSLAPILLGLSIAISSYLFSMTLLLNNPALTWFIHYSPFFLSLIGFIFLYTIVPNCSIKIRHAFGGGVVAALLFETTKQGFAFYLTRYHTYELLYGAFAIVPIFFIWIYFMWIITLLGAEISYAFSVYHKRRNGPTLDGFSHALLWLQELWKAHQHGNGLTLNQLINVNTQPFAVDAEDMIKILTEYELIHPTVNGLYRLSRDLNHLTLYDLSQLLPYRLPNQHELQDAHTALSHWKITFRNNDKELQKTFHVSLEEVFKSKA